MKKNEHPEKLIKQILMLLQKHVERECISSVILSGSFGRNEPTYVCDNDKMKLISDVEIGIVPTHIWRKQEVEQIVRLVSSEFKENINFMILSQKRVRKAHNHNFAVISPQYKTLFTFDLYNGSKTICGKDFIRDHNITVEDIDPYEAKRVIANRIGELVFLQTNLVAKEQEEAQVQWKGKLVLAIASAWLIGEGLYVSSYCEQYNILKENSNIVEETIGDNFISEYERVFMYLRNGGTRYEVADELMRFYVENMDKYLQKKRICTSKTGCVSNHIKVILRYLKTDMKFGLFSFEEKILQELITDYWKNSREIIYVANVWKQVLY